MSRRAGSDDASTETNAVVATANVRMTTSPYRRKVVIETSPWKIVGSNRDLIPSNRTSRSETRTCFSSSPLKVFFIAGLFRPTRVFFWHDNITSVREFHNILVDRRVQCIASGPYTEVWIASPAIVHLPVRMISLNRPRLLHQPPNPLIHERWIQQPHRPT